LQDEAAKVRAEVEAAGGLNAVLGDDKKMGAVLVAMGGGADALQLAAVRQVRELLTAAAEDGPHEAIENLTMRAFWRRKCKELELPWALWWMLFPKNMSDLLDPAAATELTRLLSSDAARRAFELAVERVPPATSISLLEVAKAFQDADADVNAIVVTLIGDAATAGDGKAAGGAAAFQPSQLRCQLPNTDGTLIGRDDDVAAILQALAAGRGVAVIAAGGLGKTQLALEAGWRLARSGGADAGAFFVDLREASDAESVALRFAAALGADKAGDAAISDRLRSLCGGCAESGLLLLADNAEDALGADGAAVRLRSLLAAALAASPRVRLLLTSRVPVAAPGVTERSLGPLVPAEAALVAAAAAPGLPSAETQAVVAAAGGSPLLLRLLADALKTGRLTVQVRLSLTLLLTCARMHALRQRHVCSL
jgi:hypothetical protein